MAAPDSPTYLVDANSDPAVLKICGRASYTNCNPVHAFFRRMIEGGRQHVVVDFEECTAMDSTFLGVLAGAAMQIRRSSTHGSLVLTHLDGNNLRLVRELGLDRVLEIATGDPPTVDGKTLESVQGEQAAPDTILNAHENLVRADESNETRFQDVLSFLRGGTERGSDPEE